MKTKITGITTTMKVGNNQKAANLRRGSRDFLRSVEVRRGKSRVFHLNLSGPSANKAVVQRSELPHPLQATKTGGRSIAPFDQSSPDGPARKTFSNLHALNIQADGSTSRFKIISSLACYHSTHPLPQVVLTSSKLDSSLFREQGKSNTG